MKTLIIYLGVFAVTIFTSCKAESGFKNEFFKQNKQVITNLFLGNEQIENLLATENAEVSLLKDTNITEAGTTFHASKTSIKTTYTKSIEEVIAEDNLITENNDNELQVVPFNKSVLKIIIEDNKIIDGTCTEEVHPLDFKLINATLNTSNNVDFDIIIFDKNAIKS